MKLVLNLKAPYNKLFAVNIVLDFMTPNISGNIIVICIKLEAGVKFDKSKPLL